MPIRLAGSMIHHDSASRPSPKQYPFALAQRSASGTVAAWDFVSYRLAFGGRATAVHPSTCPIPSACKRTVSHHPATKRAGDCAPATAVHPSTPTGTGNGRTFPRTVGHHSATHRHKHGAENAANHLPAPATPDTGHGTAARQLVAHPGQGKANKPALHLLALADSGNTGSPNRTPDQRYLATLWPGGSAQNKAVPASASPLPPTRYRAIASQHLATNQPGTAHQPGTSLSSSQAWCGSRHCDHLRPQPGHRRAQSRQRHCRAQSRQRPGRNQTGCW